MATMTFSRSHATHRSLDLTMLRSVAFYVAISAIAIAVAIPAAIATVG